MLVKAVKAAGCSGGEAQISSGPAGHKEPASGGRIHDCIWTETFHGWFLLDIGGGSIHDQQYPPVKSTHTAQLHPGIHLCTKTQSINQRRVGGWSGSF